MKVHEICLPYRVDITRRIVVQFVFVVNVVGDDFGEICVYQGVVSVEYVYINSIVEVIGSVHANSPCDDVIACFIDADHAEVVNRQICLEVVRFVPVQKGRTCVGHINGRGEDELRFSEKSQTCGIDGDR